MTAAQEGIYEGIEKTQIRKDVAGLARRLSMLSRSAPRAEIVKRTGLSESYVGNMIRAWTHLADPIRRAWGRLRIPTDVIVRWSKITSASQQLAAFERWKKNPVRAARPRREARGVEAEDLRRGVEKLIAESEGTPEDLRTDLIALLEHVDARESTPARRKRKT